METRRSGPITGLLIGIAVAAGIVLVGGVLAAQAGRSETIPPLTCDSRSDCGSRLMGGLQITFTGWSCTEGFLVRSAATRKLAVLTAGHCLAGSGIYALWSHHGVAMGRASAEAFEPGSNADVGVIDLVGPGASNEVYGPSGADIRNVTGTASNASQTVGSQVCFSGATSGWRCGSIVAADVDTPVGGRLIHHTWWTDFPSAAGDSGSPVLDHDGQAAGIVIATTATQSVYSTVDWIVAQLGTRPCVNANCD